MRIQDPLLRLLKNLITGGLLLQLPSHCNNRNNLYLGTLKLNNLYHGNSLMKWPFFLAWQRVEFESRFSTRTRAMSSNPRLELNTHNLRVWLGLADEFGCQTHTRLITRTQSQTLESNSTRCHANWIEPSQYPKVENGHCPAESWSVNR